MTWLLRLSQRFRGDSSGSHSFYDSDTTSFNVYQSPDVPWVFLGGAQEFDEANQMAIERLGQPICIRVDVSGQSNEELPPATIKRPFPEPFIWESDMFFKWQKEFNDTADDLVGLIQQNRCPIYIHCAMGANRSVSLLAAALTKITGRRLFDVLQEMKTRRSFVSPHDGYVMMALLYSPSDSEETKQRMQQMLNLENSSSKSEEYTQNNTPPLDSEVS